MINYNIFLFGSLACVLICYVVYFISDNDLWLSLGYVFLLSSLSFIFAYVYMFFYGGFNV